MIELPPPDHIGEEMVPGLNLKPIPRAAKVTALPGRVLEVTWTDGRTVQVDLTGWIEAPGLSGVQRLRDPVVFSRIVITDYGSTLEWDGDEDLVIDTAHLEMLAEQQTEFSSADLVAWQDRHRINNGEAAAMLDVHPNTWGNYRRPGAKVPRTIAMALRAMDRDPVMFTAYYRPRRHGVGADLGER